MNKSGVLLLAALLLPLWAAAQFSPTAHDARNGAMGGCHILPSDSGAYAVIAWRQGYMTQGMATRNIVAGTPLGRVASLHGRYSYFGDADYHEQQGAMACGIRVAPWLTAAVYGLYSNIGTSDAHYRQQHWLDGGVVVQLVENKPVAHGGGYFAVGSRTWDTNRPVGFVVGLTYRPVSELLTVVELASEERMRLHCGAEYAYGNRWFARAGLSTSPLVVTFGVGCRNNHYHIDLGTEVHPVLGLSPQISLGVCL